MSLGRLPQKTVEISDGKSSNFLPMNKNSCYIFKSLDSYAVSIIFFSKGKGIFFLLNCCILFEYCVCIYMCIVYNSQEKQLL